MKRFLSIFLLLFAVLTTSALDKRQTQINNIKKSKEYLYSDITMSTREEATSQAFEQLQQEILSWATERANKKVGTVSLKQINQLTDTIMLRRAEMYRVFAYVKKTKLVPVFNEWNLVLIDGLDSDEGNTPEDLPEDQQPLETPDKSEETESPHIQPEDHPKDTIANQEIRDLLKKNFLGRKGGVIEQIKKAKNFFELRQIMEPLKEKGDITGYGKYATAKKPEDCYLIVYDPAGNIKAFLGKGENVRINLKTGMDDSIKNYRGCGAIWFTLNE